MTRKRGRSNPKSKSRTPTPARVQRFAFFGSRPLLEGEDAALYDDLVTRMYAAVKPVDIIDEMYVADVVFLEWEIMRWRRLKFNLLQASVHEELQGFLNQQLNFDAYRESFAKLLEEIFQELIQKYDAQDAKSQQDTIDKVIRVVTGAKPDMEDIVAEAKAHRAKEVAQEYARREPDAVKRVNELLASDRRTMHDLMLEGLLGKLDEIERIDRQITIAETRRNLSLREIDRRRAVLGEALRRTVQEVEGKFEVIETTPSEGKKARGDCGPGLEIGDGALMILSV